MKNHKQLFEVLENSGGSVITHLYLIINEASKPFKDIRDEHGDILDRLYEYPSDLFEVLIDKDYENLLRSFIEEGSIFHHLLERGFGGFLAEVEIPIHNNFFEEDGEIKGRLTGVKEIKLIYADCIETLINKINQHFQNRHQYWYNREKENLKILDS